MPEEPLAVRETYGDAPGWSTKERPAGAPSSAPPAPVPHPDAPAESSPAEEVVVEEQATQEGTAPSTQPEPPTRKWNEPPESRWEELRQQKAAAEARAAQAESLARMALEKVQGPQAPSVPVVDPWAGLVDHPDPATAQFYQKQQQLFQHEARKVAEAQGQSVLQAVDAGRRELAAIKISQFRKDNPDIKPGSPEEAQIAGFVGQGVDLEVAKKLVLYDTLERENRALKAKQSSVPQKRAANTESSAGMPSTTGLPRPRGTTEEVAREVLDKGGSPLDAAAAFFGMKRR